LGEHAYREDSWGVDYSRAFSWLALVMEPIALHGITINLNDWLNRRPLQHKSDSSPIERFHLLLKTKTTMDSVISYNEVGENREFCGNYLRVSKEGNLEYADSHFSFWAKDEVRCFGYISLIGIAWQFLFLAKRLLEDIGFDGGVRFLFNLIGSRDTILSEFSTEPGVEGKRWQDPFSSTGYYHMRDQLFGLKCQESNLQMEYRVGLHDLTEESSFEIVKDIAQQLALAYNHQSLPRCFNYGTDVFPWAQYLSSIRGLGG
jgi:hypothetical protein